MRKKAVIYIVILMEILCVAYLFPKKGAPQRDFYKEKFSEICLNTADLFQAYERVDYLLANYGFNSQVYNVMYYADKEPKKNKEYVVYFEPLPESEAGFSLLDPKGKIKIYVRSLKSFEEYRKTANDLEVFYESFGSLYDLGRNGYRP